MFTSRRYVCLLSVYYETVPARAVYFSFEVKLLKIDHSCATSPNSFQRDVPRLRLCSARIKTAFNFIEKYVEARLDFGIKIKWSLSLEFLQNGDASLKNTFVSLHRVDVELEWPCNTF